MSSGQTADSAGAGVAPAPDRRRIELGRRGEDAVAADYERRGYRVVARNWRDGRRGELDLVVVGPGVVAGVEVKTRRTDAFGDGLEAITAVKARRLRGLVAAWVAQRGITLPPGADLRVDVAAVRWPRGRPPEIEVVEAAC